MRLFPLLLCLSLSAFAQDEPPAAGGGGRGGRGGPGSNEPINESTFSALRARQIGPAFVSGRISQIAVFPDDSNHYLIAAGLRQHLLHHQQRHHLDPGLRQLRLLLHRLDHHRSQESLHRLGGHGREQQPAQRLLRRRRLQERRRRAHLPQRGPQTHRAHRPHRGGPARFQRGVRGRPRPPVEGRRRARPLQDHRRRQDLVAEPDQGRRLHRLQRRHHGPAQSRYPAGRHPPAAAPLFRHDSRRPGERAVPLHRRRQDLDPGARRFPHRRPRPHRPQPGARKSQHHLRAGGRPGRARRHLPLHR